MATFAGIDCGTNSIRLLIVERGPDGVCRDVLRTMRVVRLGEGLDDSGVISRAALDRTFAACADYAQIIAAHDVQRMRFMATSASRDARNREEFIDGVNRLMGVRPEVITGAEEAALSFGGAIGSPVVRDAAPGPRLVVDIGGGSTEFVLGEDAPSAARSVDIGCVRLAERWLRADPPAAAELAALAGDADAAIARAATEVPLGSAASLIGVAGTVTTVAALALGLPEYDADALHGAVISAGDVHRVAAELAAMTLAQRLALPVMHPGRADVIVSGALIWSRIVTAVGLPHVVVSEHDILDGIARSAATGC